MMEKLEELIRRSGLSQLATERKLGLPSSRIAKWKMGRGEIGAREALEISRFFGVALDSFVDDTKDINSVGDTLPPADIALLELAHSLEGGTSRALRLLAQAMSRPDTYGIIDPQYPPGIEPYKESAKPSPTPGHGRRGTV